MRQIRLKVRLKVRLTAYAKASALKKPDPTSAT